MIPSRSGILAEALSTLIKTFLIVILLNLYYTFITYDGPKSNEQRAKINEKRTKSNQQQTKCNEQRAKSNEQQAKSSASRDTHIRFHSR